MVKLLYKFYALTARERRRFWIQQENKKRRIVKDFSDRFQRALNADTAPFISAYQSGGQQAASRYIQSLLISGNIQRVMRLMYSQVGARYAKEAYGSLNVRKAFGNLVEWFDSIMQYIGMEFYNKGLLKITQTTRKILQDVLDKSIQEGWGYLETAKYFKETIPGINASRAEMIARTESGKAIHAGTYVGVDKSIWQKEKVWISAQDQRTRRNRENNPKKADHLLLDGQTVDFNQYFHDDTNGVKMLHTHDPKAPASEVVNCRCSYAVINKRDANGRLIRK